MRGRSNDNTLELEVLLYDGTVMNVGPATEAEIDGIIAEGGHEPGSLKHCECFATSIRRWSGSAYHRYPAHLRLQPERAPPETASVWRARLSARRRRVLWCSPPSCG